MQSYRRGARECMQAYGSKPGSCQAKPEDRSIVVQITDSCPECSTDQMDLQANIWAQIANPAPAGGRVNMQYRVRLHKTLSVICVDLIAALGRGCHQCRNLPSFNPKVSLQPSMWGRLMHTYI